MSHFYSQAHSDHMMRFIVNKQDDADDDDKVEISEEKDAMEGRR